METATFIQVKIDRDSVHAGDDLDSHATILSVSASATISEFLTQVRKTHYLASIMGGKATWLIYIYSEGAKKKCIGVMAQQWEESKLIVPADMSIKDLFPAQDASFYFRYWLQSDPEAVFSSVLNGKELPNRQG